MRSIAPDVTEGPRADIFACVSAVPGIHLRHVERETRLPLGQVLYHLDRLERMGLVVAARDMGFKRYFPAQEVSRSEKRYLAALRHGAPRRILLTLLARGSANHKELQEVIGVAGSTLSFHLQRLLASGVLARDRHGTANVYSIVEPHAVRRELVFWRESFRDPEVDKYVRSLLERLPALDDAWVHVPLSS